MAETKPEPNSIEEARDEFSESVIWDDVPSPYRRLVQSVYHAPTCRYIYLGILALNIALAIWIIVDAIRGSMPHAVFYVFELLVNVALMSDVIVRFWLNGCYRFWHSISNVFEFVLVSVCFLLTIVTIARIISTCKK